MIYYNYNTYMSFVIAFVVQRIYVCSLRLLMRTTLTCTFVRIIAGPSPRHVASYRENFFTLAFVVEQVSLSRSSTRTPVPSVACPVNETWPMPFPRWNKIGPLVKSLTDRQGVYYMRCMCTCTKNISTKATMFRPGEIS